MLLIANIVIFVVYWLSASNILLGDRFAAEIEDKFTMIPAEIIRGQRLFTLFTSMFMHANWFHLLGNMLFLYVFGDNVEDAFGHASYLALYLISGLIAGLAQILISMLLLGDLTIGVIGASGAISGVLGAYLVLYPTARIVTLVGYFIVPLPAILFLGFWFIMQWAYGIFDPLGGVAYFAHIGGFIAGILLGLTIGRKRKKAREARLRF